MESEAVPTPDELREFTHDELGELTDNYSEDNFLGETKYAKFYRGKIETRGEVTVKICKKFIDSACQIPSNEHSRFKHEIEFLRHPKIKGHQQNLATPIGYCPQAPGVVYDTNPRGTLETLILQDDFTWSQRLKVALQLARMVAFFHNYSPPFIWCNIDAAQIMVDQDYNMMLVDLGMLVGGFNCSRRNILRGRMGEAHNYKDLQFLFVGGWSKTHDVFSYGILLLSLISKRVFDISRPETSIALWAKKNCKEKMSWSELERNAFDVHEIFKEDPDYDVYDANKIMKLAMSCIELLPVDRPTIAEIILALQTLHVVLLNGTGEAVKSEVLQFLPCELRKIIGEFSEETFLGKTQFGKLYRGRILDGANRNEARAVTVKIWDDSMCGLAHPMEKWSKLTDEVYFLQHPSVNCHRQNLAEPIGYCRKCELLGVVYDINPRDTLQNLILKDDFTWLERIKVALQFAHLLVFFHDCKPPYIVRNIDAAHIMVDQDCNPVLFDVGMLVGGLFGTTSNIPNGNLHGAPGYEDLHFLDVGGWSIARDVFSYGVLLMNLIARRVFDISDPQIPVALWANAFCKECRSLMEFEWIFSHVNEIFRKDPHYNVFDAYRIIKLAMSCIQFLPDDRPSMKQTYESLQALHVVQRTGIGGARKSVLREFLPKEWREFIDIHRQENFLGDTQFAKLYRGMISCGAGQTRSVTVKIWDDSNCRSIDLLEKMSELMDEVYLLQHLNVNGRQQNLAKPIGYTLECQSPGIVYDLNPRDTLDKLILRDDFNWLQRIKVAAQMAHLLHFLHHYDPPFIVRNISPAHILVDKEYNPVLFDFGMMVGGLFGKVRDIPKKELNFLVGAPSYVDPRLALTGHWSVACDVYSFGVVLVNLFTKIVTDSGRPGSALKFGRIIKCLHEKRTQENLDELFEHVHRKFKNDPDYDREDAFDILRLAIHCVEFSPKDRPSTYQTCMYLRRLNAVKHFKKEFGIEDYSGIEDYQYGVVGKKYTC